MQLCPCFNAIIKTVLSAHESVNKSFIFPVTCNGDTFQCSDLRCIPSSRKCDSFLDCASGEDEANCIPGSLSSCIEWWIRGYRQTGQYVVRKYKYITCRNACFRGLAKLSLEASVSVTSRDKYINVIPMKRVIILITSFKDTKISHHLSQ